MKFMPYDRGLAIAYAKKWALSRNPRYYNFEEIGGDCTNFASQCLFAGAGVVNYNADNGWYYNSINDRAPAWTSAKLFRKFLLSNTSMGPMATHVPISKLEAGDFISLHNGVECYHTLVVVDISGAIPLVCAHTDDSYMRRLDTYYAQSFLPLHIIGVNS